MISSVHQGRNLVLYISESLLGQRRLSRITTYDLKSNELVVVNSGLGLDLFMMDDRGVIIEDDIMTIPFRRNDSSGGNYSNQTGCITTSGNPYEVGDPEEDYQNIISNPNGDSMLIRTEFNGNDYRDDYLNVLCLPASFGLTKVTNDNYHCYHYGIYLKNSKSATVSYPVKHLINDRNFNVANLSGSLLNTDDMVCYCIDSGFNRINYSVLSLPKTYDGDLELISPKGYHGSEVSLGRAVLVKLDKKVYLVSLYQTSFVYEVRDEGLVKINDEFDLNSQFRFKSYQRFGINNEGRINSITGVNGRLYTIVTDKSTNSMHLIYTNDFFRSWNYTEVEVLITDNLLNLSFIIVQ